jgi:hypothetical protein
MSRLFEISKTIPLLPNVRKPFILFVKCYSRWNIYVVKLNTMLKIHRSIILPLTLSSVFAFHSPLYFRSCNFKILVGVLLFDLDLIVNTSLILKLYFTVLNNATRISLFTLIQCECKRSRSCNGATKNTE